MVNFNESVAIWSANRLQVVPNLVICGAANVVVLKEAVAMGLQAIPTLHCFLAGYQDIDICQHSRARVRICVHE